MASDKQERMFKILLEQGIIDRLSEIEEKGIDAQVILDHSKGSIKKMRVTDYIPIKVVNI